MQHRDSMRAAPPRKSHELPHGVRPAEAVNRKARDWIPQFRDAPGPRTIVMKAHGVDLESVAVDSPEQLDQLTLRSAGNVSVDEDGNREQGHWTFRTRRRPAAPSALHMCSRPGRDTADATARIRRDPKAAACDRGGPSGVHERGDR